MSWLKCCDNCGAISNGFWGPPNVTARKNGSDLTIRLREDNSFSIPPLPRYPGLYESVGSSSNDLESMNTLHFCDEECLLAKIRSLLQSANAESPEPGETAEKSVKTREK